MIINGTRPLSTTLYELVNRVSKSGWRRLDAGPCVICLGPASGVGICDGCRRALPFNHSACPQCALPLPPAAAGASCGACQRARPPFSQTQAPWLYRFPVSNLIGRFKFQGDRAGGRALSHLMATELRGLEYPLPECLVPCPLYGPRYRTRGFNQAADIAQWLGDELGIPVAHNLCQRRRMHAPQASLGRRQRLRNLSGSFRLRNVPPAHVAVVDDVMTTGATVSALARLLLAGGARQVDVWVLARTP